MGDCEVYCPVCGMCCHPTGYEVHDGDIVFTRFVYSCPGCGWDNDLDPPWDIGGSGWVNPDQFDGGLSN